MCDTGSKFLSKLSPGKLTVYNWLQLDKSSPHEVVLKNVQPEVTGKYKCEVSTDSPNFFTLMEAGYMYVVGKLFH